MDLVISSDDDAEQGEEEDLSRVDARDTQRLAKL